MKDILLKNRLKLMRKCGTYSRLRKKFGPHYKTNNISLGNEEKGSVAPIFEESSVLVDLNNDSLDATVNPLNTDSDFEGCRDQRSQLINGIRQWATDFHISQSALQSLTAVLNENLNLNLPKDSRTLMATPRSLDLTQIDETGLYWHQGLEYCLRTALKNVSQAMTVSLNFNIDGLPLYKSSTKSFWPILFNIQEFHEIQPLIIGIFYGISKPKDATVYLTPFVNELLQLLPYGLNINGHRISIRIRCFICDTPARAFIKSVINFNGKYGCIKCTTKGVYSQISKTMVFPNSKAIKRTDELFRAMEYPNHQRSHSTLTRLPIDMIEDIVVADSLHLLELGVMKKLLNGWRTGSMSMKTKWSTFQKKEISELLVAVKFPVEIHRKMRSLDLVSLWKGLEYRNFLNYAGVVLLKDYLPEKYYNNFLLLFCAVRICSAAKYSNLLHIARELFEDFLKGFKSLYGIEFMTSNIHNLCHIVDEVEKFGPLSTISAYPFENYLHSLKKMIKTGPNPLAQIAGRVTESMQTYEAVIDNKLNEPVIGNQRQRFVDISKSSESKLVFPGFILSTSFQDKWILLEDQSIVAFSSVLKMDSKCFIQGQVISTKRVYFEKPFKSSFLHIYIADSVFSEERLVDVDNIFCKLVAIPRKEGVVFTPLIHTIIC